MFNAQASADTLVIPPVGGTGGSSKESALAALADGALGGTDPSRSSGAQEAFEGRAHREEKSAQLEGGGDARRVGYAEAAGRSRAGAIRRSSRAKRKSSEKEEEGYTLQIEARQKGGSVRCVLVGLRRGAEAGRDTLDFAQPPAIGEGVRLSVEERVGGRLASHAGSFKPTGGEGQSWKVVLRNRTKERQSVRLLFRSVGRRPEGHGRYVLDLGAGCRVAPGGRLRVRAGEERPLKVIVGTEAFARKRSEGVSLRRYETELRGNYRNPFGEETTLAYTLSEKQEVTIEVYNILGQRVRTLVKGTREAGLHRSKWEGENRYGDPVGSGVYFYWLETGDVTETRKMVLVR